MTRTLHTSGHDHDHGHEHQQGPRPSRGRRHRRRERRGLLLTLGTTFVILVAEIVGGVLSNSLALLADAGHMFSDALAILLAYLALTFAGRPATPNKTYGWHRLEILAALANGVTLVVISVFIVWEAWERMVDPPEVQTELMMVIAAIGLFANALGLVFLSGHGHSLNVRGAFLHVLGDLLSSVGVLIGGAVMWWTGWRIVDPVVSVVIAVIIVLGAWRLLKEAVDVLLEGTPVGIDAREVARELTSIDGVRGVHDLHVWSLTSGVPAMSCHVAVRSELLSETAALLDRLRSLLRDRFDIEHATLQIEPDDYLTRRTVVWRLDDDRGRRPDPAESSRERAPKSGREEERERE